MLAGGVEPEVWAKKGECDFVSGVIDHFVLTVCVSRATVGIG